MAVIVITSPVPGSLRIDTYGGAAYSSASPQSRFHANLQSVTIDGYSNANGQYLTVSNSNQQPIFEVQLPNIAQIGSSASTTFPTLNQAVVLVSNLIMH
jgi:hypothetical protein